MIYGTPLYDVYCENEVNDRNNSMNLQTKNNNKDPYLKKKGILKNASKLKPRSTSLSNLVWRTDEDDEISSILSKDYNDNNGKDGGYISDSNSITSTSTLVNNEKYYERPSSYPNDNSNNYRIPKSYSYSNYNPNRSYLADNNNINHSYSCITPNSNRQKSSDDIRRNSYKKYSNGYDKNIIKIQSAFRGYKMRKMFENIKNRKHIAIDLLRNEIQYVKNLLCLYKKYLIPLRGLKILSKAEYKVLFFQIRNILLFSRSLLQNLEGRVNSWNSYQIIGDIFIEAANKLDIYVTFMNNYPRAMGFFDMCEKKNEEFQKYINQIHEDQNWSFVMVYNDIYNHIDLYINYLKNILQFTSRKHEDFDLISEALNRIEYMKNNVINSKDNFNFLVELEDSISKLPSILSIPSLEFVYEEDVFEDDGDNIDKSSSVISFSSSELFRSIVKPRHLIIFKNVILCLKQKNNSQSNSSKKYIFKWALSFYDILTIKTHHIDNDFFISIKWKGDRSHIYEKNILTKDKKSFDLWINHLKNIRRDTLKSLEEEKYNLDIQIYHENPLQGMGLLVPKANILPQDAASFMTSVSKSSSISSFTKYEPSGIMEQNKSNNRMSNSG
ncbi:Dbl homology domain-containing protein, partial [Anaeromyces robustus]